MTTIHTHDLFTPGSAVVHLNGAILGVHHRPLWFVSHFRAARRAGLMTDFVSVTVLVDSVLIACDGGRLCRPLIVCHEGRPLLLQHHIDVRPRFHSALLFRAPSLDAGGSAMLQAH